MSSYVRDVDYSHIKSPQLLGRLDMELTERCNNNCIHCYINLPADSPAREREMTASEIKAILAEAAGLGCLTVRFTGGEPLLRKDFEEIYLFARRLGMKVMLFTNGCLITPHLADLFVDIPPKELVEISVYGMTEKSYEAVTRTPGSYRAAMRGIELLRERGVPFVVKAAVLPQNRRDLDAFEAWASNIPWMKKLPMYSCLFDLRARRDSEEKNALIRSVRATPEEGLAVLTRDRDRYYEEMRQFCAKFMKSSGDLIFSCGCGKGGCVDAYGFFQPCMMLRVPELVCNLREVSLKDALENRFPKLRGIRAKNPEYLARCARCFLKGLCEQCPAKSWMENGTLDTPVEYLCKVAHKRARDLGLLKDRENAWEVSRGRDKNG